MEVGVSVLPSRAGLPTLSVQASASKASLAAAPSSRYCCHRNAWSTSNRSCFPLRHRRRRARACSTPGWPALVKAARRAWWAPPADHLSRSLARNGMPATLFGFVRRVSGWSQFRVSCLAVAVFVLTTAPLEMQRRILNAAVLDGNVMQVLALAVVYAGIVLTEDLVKLLMNIYRGWIGEKAVRILRLAASALVDSMPEQRARADIQGVE